MPYFVSDTQGSCVLLAPCFISTNNIQITQTSSSSVGALRELAAAWFAAVEDWATTPLDSSGKELPWWKQYEDAAWNAVEPGQSPITGVLPTGEAYAEAMMQQATGATAFIRAPTTDVRMTSDEVLARALRRVSRNTKLELSEEIVKKK